MGSLVKPMVEIPSEMITNPLVEVPSSERQKRRSKYKFPCKYCGKIFDFIGHMQIHEKTHTGELSHKLSEKPASFFIEPKVEISSEMVTNPLVEKSEKPVDIHVKPMIEIPSKIITTPMAEIVESEVQKLKPKKKRTKSVFPSKYCGKIFDRIGHMQNHEKNPHWRTTLRM